MHTQPKQLSPESFQKYGTYADLLHPSGVVIGDEPVLFYRDMLTMEIGAGALPAFSTCKVLKRPFSVTELEYHDYACEGAMPLDGDIFLAVAPATADDDVDPADVEVFRVPKGVFVRCNRGVWHSAPYACGDEANVLIVLPERTYHNDCHKFPIRSEVGF